MTKVRTKEKIKQTALRLFNEQDAFSVTTNHIAKEAGISPGNLYYHYKNKEEIIRELFGEMQVFLDDCMDFSQMMTTDNPLKMLFGMFERHLDVFWNYRFLKRDIAILITIDPELRRTFVEKQEMRIGHIVGMIKFMIGQGIFSDEGGEEEILKRAKMGWFIGAYWQVFADSMGEMSPESLKESKEYIKEFVIYPRLTEKGWKLLEE